MSSEHLLKKENWQWLKIVLFLFLFALLTNWPGMSISPSTTSASSLTTSLRSCRSCKCLRIWSIQTNSRNRWCYWWFAILCQVTRYHWAPWRKKLGKIFSVVFTSDWFFRREQRFSYKMNIFSGLQFFNCMHLISWLFFALRAHRLTLSLPKSGDRVELLVFQ